MLDAVLSLTMRFCGSGAGRPCGLCHAPARVLRAADHWRDKALHPAQLLWLRHAPRANRGGHAARSAVPVPRGLRSGRADDEPQTDGLGRRKRTVRPVLADQMQAMNGLSHTRLGSKLLWRLSWRVRRCRLGAARDAVAARPARQPAGKRPKPKSDGGTHG